MAKEEHIELDGVVKECFPNTTFRVECENGHELLCYLAGKMRRYYIRVLPGDHVRVQISPYDLSRGRITRRYRKPPVKEPPPQAEAAPDQTATDDSATPKSSE